jgi:hypothetical protein
MQISNWTTYRQLRRPHPAITGINAKCVVVELVVVERQEVVVLRLEKDNRIEWGEPYFNFTLIAKRL